MTTGTIRRSRGTDASARSRSGCLRGSGVRKRRLVHAEPGKDRGGFLVARPALEHGECSKRETRLIVHIRLLGDLERALERCARLLGVSALREGRSANPLEERMNRRGNTGTIHPCERV